MSLGWGDRMPACVCIIRMMLRYSVCVGLVVLVSLSLSLSHSLLLNEKLGCNRIRCSEHVVDMI
jgi:hypothetical protein